MLEAPAGDDWIHEIKFDGYRTLLVVGGGQARAFTRNGYDWSDSYQPIVDEAAKLTLPIGRARWRDGQFHRCR